MRAKAEYPTIHGAQHLGDGSDPIPGIGDGIRFNTDNEGGWLYVVTNDSTDIDFGELGILFADKSGQGVLFLAFNVAETESSSLLLSDDTLEFGLSDKFAVNMDRAGGMMTLKILTAGDTYQVLDSTDAPLVTYTG